MLVIFLIFEHRYVKNDEFIVCSVEHALCDFELSREIAVTCLVSSDNERANLFDGERDQTVLVCDTFVDMLRVVLVDLHKNILYFLALSDVYSIHFNGIIASAVLGHQNVEITLSLLHLQVRIVLWVTRRLHIQQVLTLDEVSGPTVAVCVPKHLELEVFNGRLLLLFLFLILIFLRDFRY